jgi:hypothetical protein
MDQYEKADHIGLAHLQTWYDNMSDNEKIFICDSIAESIANKEPIPLWEAYVAIAYYNKISIAQAQDVFFTENALNPYGLVP